MAESPENARLDHLDATRAFALLLGIVFHASLSFLPFFIGWAVQDIATSGVVATFVTVSHSFRMEAFFLLAGFFSHMTFHRRGAASFWRTRALRIVVPFVAGWFILRPLIVSGWIMGGASLRGDYDFWAGIAAGFQSLATLPAGIFAGSHLWFLYYLVLITALAVAARTALTAREAWSAAITRGADAITAWLARSAWALPALAIPTAGALWFMRFWGMDTPEQTLRPNLPVLLVYGGWFTLGWLFHRQPRAIESFGRLSPHRWILAAAAVAGVLLLGRFERLTGHTYHTAAHLGFVVSYALMMGSLVALTLGVFQRLCRRANAVVRYVADASYWLYLVHLPIVVWLQVAFAEVALHWSLKLTAIVVVTLGVSLLGYDLLVRATWLGWLLNGQRRARVFRWRRTRRSDERGALEEAS